MERIQRFLKLAIFAQLGVCAGRVIAKYLHYAAHPNFYRMQSAPWYMGILATLAFTAVTVTLTAAVYLLIGRYRKKKDRKRIETKANE